VNESHPVHPGGGELIEIEAFLSPWFSPESFQRREKNGEVLFPFQPLAPGGETVLEFFPAAGKENEQGELFSQASHSGVLQVSAALVDQTGNLGHDPGPVLADGRQSEVSFHKASWKDSDQQSAVSAQLSAFSKSHKSLYGKREIGDRV
jgi:hypothetical protein